MSLLCGASHLANHYYWTLANTPLRYPAAAPSHGDSEASAPSHILADHRWGRWEGGPTQCPSCVSWSRWSDHWDHSRKQGTELALLGPWLWTSSPTTKDGTISLKYSVDSALPQGVGGGSSSAAVSREGHGQYVPLLKGTLFPWYSNFMSKFYKTKIP